MTVTVHHGDCLDVLRTMDADSLDSVITDPPYCSGGVTEAGRGRSTHQGLRSTGLREGRFSWFDGDVMTTPGLTWLLRSMAFEAQRIVKETGHLLVFADWRMVPSLAPAIESAGWRYRSQIIWNKGSMGCGLGFRPQHEVIMHFTGRAPVFHTADTGNVITCKRIATAAREHAAQKPIELLRRLIRVVSPEGGTICDPFAGSGSLGAAGQAEARDVILIERDPELCCHMRGEDAPLLTSCA